jgi:hypothetical protein
MGKNLRTEKALIDSGAYVPGDFEDSPMVMKQAERPAKGIGKQMDQAAYDKQKAADNARADANRQAQKDKQSRQRMRGY